MQIIEIQLEDETFERARRLAQSRLCTLEELLKEIIEQVGMAEEFAEDQNWAKFTTEQFLKGYSEGDSIYDQLSTG